MPKRHSLNQNYFVVYLYEKFLKKKKTEKKILWWNPSEMVLSKKSFVSLIQLDPKEIRIYVRTNYSKSPDFSQSIVALGGICWQWRLSFVWQRSGSPLRTKARNAMVGRTVESYRWILFWYWISSNLWNWRTTIKQLSKAAK